MVVIGYLRAVVACCDVFNLEAVPVCLVGVLLVSADLLRSLLIGLGVRFVGVIVPKPMGLLLRFCSVILSYCLGGLKPKTFLVCMAL